MPRGIPNAKRDESALRYTSFHVPLAPNPKHVGSTYLKSESQTVWSRNAIRAHRTRTVSDEAGAATPTETRRGAKVIVIHPGSRFLRIGRASDVTPLSVPNVIARRYSSTVPSQTYVEGISRPREDRKRSTPSTTAPPGDEYAVNVASDDPFDAKVAAITVSLRDRMRFYKLRVTTNSASIATTFNEQFRPEIIPEVNDPYHVDWIHSSEEPYLVGETALRLANPEEMGYIMRWPIYGGNFNTRDYPSAQLILSDIETIFRESLKLKGIEPSAYKDHSVVLVIPDYYDRLYVESLVRILLVDMGFKQICAQQESLAATYGAGISNACVVDMGAVKTSIACVDDGLVIADTRMVLSMGGNDITEFLYVLLEKIGFPYRDINLARSYDWKVMEDLKARLCTLAEGDVALNLYDFSVRRPGHATEKYGLRAYDEIILAAMCLFEPRVIEFEQKRAGMRFLMRAPDMAEEMVEQSADKLSERYTQAMMISTQHLFPVVPPPTTLEQAPLLVTPALQTPATTEGQSLAVSPQPGASASATAPVTPSAEESAQAAKEDQGGDVEMGDATVAESRGKDSKGEEGKDDETEKDEGGSEKEDERKVKSEPESTDKLLGPDTDKEKAKEKEKSAAPDAAVEVIDVDQLDDKAASQTVTATHPPPPHIPTQMPFSAFNIDVAFEASKLPLDVAIFNSARAAGGDEKIRKYLQAVLVIGGTALVPGMAHALESRLQAIATPLVPNMEKVQIIPPPKDVDPRVLAWKGAAVLGKMDGVADLWITGADWELFGMRALKERCFYL
ncbi:actin-like ATPase domain-containing protein [Dichomitus squalens]|uniref:Actin-like ATPase domain-containing protein n=1 Tax=Dichomitus squalens TaxID=114155 RepID=A0A4Q9P1V1_9APHY|nr:actin-like ATPase domain-containing protein [Dichomitus squalens LYAD-421 SS1]EJF64395.1 actin-like ATPase domain-containing protein [Dichomitus squalens LYAD-421 SS1]TBU47485.1 actin-like ATPase domain-containing protein [Dichomitus squalens]TBU57660.1 actin-like ATPase domain-containing protein [Dichomitus squalens]